MYRLFTSREVRIGKNCAQGLGYRPRLQACERPENFRAVIMALEIVQFVANPEQIVMKTEVIQVEERDFTERFLFT